MSASALVGLDHALVTLVAASADLVATLARKRQNDTARELDALAYPCSASFVMAHGRLWPYEHAGKRRKPEGAQRQCFMNAAKLAIQGAGLTYCEGYALTAGIPIPIQHAWVVGLDGKVVDPTWRGRGERAYLGVPFRTSYLLAVVVRRETWGPLIDRMEEGFPLLSGAETPEEAVQAWPQG